MLTRRKFLTTLAVAPVLGAIGSCRTPDHTYYNDGVTDATAYLQGLIDRGGTVNIPPGTYRITGTINVGEGTRVVGSKSHYKIESDTFMNMHKKSSVSFFANIFEFVGSIGQQFCVLRG